MIIPIRCVTCNKVLADKWEKFTAMTRTVKSRQVISIDLADYEKKTPELKAFEALNITRYCCRRHMLSQIDLIEEI